MKNIKHLTLNSETSIDLIKILEDFEIVYDVENDGIGVTEYQGKVSNHKGTDYVVCEGFDPNPVIVLDVPLGMNSVDVERYLDEIKDDEYNLEFGLVGDWTLNVSVYIDVQKIDYRRYILTVSSFNVDGYFVD